MADQDDADREAERLLPCEAIDPRILTVPWGDRSRNNSCGICVTCSRRPAVAAALRAQQAIIDAGFETIKAMGERIAALEGERDALKTKIANMEDLWGFELHDDGSMTAKAIGKTLKVIGDRAIQAHVTKVEAERDALLKPYRSDGTITCGQCGSHLGSDGVVTALSEALRERDALRAALEEAIGKYDQGEWRHGDIFKLARALERPKP